MLRSIAAAVITLATWLLATSTVYLFCVFVVGDPMLDYRSPLGAFKALVEGSLAVLFIWVGLSVFGLFNKFHKMLLGLVWFLGAILFVSVVTAKEYYFWRFIAIFLQLAPFAASEWLIKRPFGRSFGRVNAGTP